MIRHLLIIFQIIDCRNKFILNLIHWIIILFILRQRQSGVDIHLPFHVTTYSISLQYLMVFHFFLFKRDLLKSDIIYEPMTNVTITIFILQI